MWRAAYGAARYGARLSGRAYRAYKGSTKARRAVKWGGRAAGVTAGIQAVSSAARVGKRKRVGGTAGSSKRRKEGSGVISSSNPGVTTKSFRKLRYKKPKAMKTMEKVGNLCTYRTNSPFGLVGTNGLQVVSGDIGYNIANTGLPIMYSETAIAELYNKAAIAYSTKADGTDGQFRRQPYAINTGTARKFFLKKGGYHIQISNQGPSTVELDCYWLMNKTTNEAAVDPVTTWQKGLTETTQGQASAETIIRFPGSKPTDSKAFNLAYKVLNKTKVFMVPGADHIFKYEFDINRIVDTAYLTQFNRFKGMTLQYMLVAKGSVADSNAGKVVGTVTTTDLKIAGVVTEFYQTQLLSYWPKVTYYDNKLDLNPGQLWEIGENGPVDTEDGTKYA